jgi:hypothetical protein
MEKSGAVGGPRKDAGSHKTLKLFILIDNHFLVVML